jgi:hypothetical protein
MRGVRRLCGVIVKFVVKAIIGVFATIGGLASALFALAFLLEDRSSFRTYEELARSGLIERGWVSAYLPRSSTDIKESHDLDTNTGWVSFRYTPGDTALAREHCHLLHKSAEGEKYVCPSFERETWILVLRVDGRGELILSYLDV